MMLPEDWVYSGLAVLAPLAVIGVMMRVRRQPLWAEAYRRILQNKLALGGLFVFALFALIGTLDGIGWHSPKHIGRETVIDAIFERPFERSYSAPFARMTADAHHPSPLLAPGSHPLGTDAVGEDVLYLAIKGCHTALFIGCVTTLIATPLALALGLISGYFGKLVDDAVQYTYTVFASVPDVLLLVALIMALGRGLMQICVALGITSWVTLCRLVRGETLRHRDREYVLSARALGASPARILWRHILPNLMPMVIISVTLGFSTVVLAEAILTYLGVGVGPDVVSWGNMIDGARDELTRDPVVWWNFSAATVFLMALVLALNLFTDGLRDAIDPRLRS